MKRVLVITGVIAALGFGYFGWVMLTRRDADLRMQRAQLASRARAHLPFGEDDGKTVRILQFYATSGVVIAGQRGIVCYGVQNAKSVRMEPAVEVLYPALAHCFWVEPRQDTTYKLIAEGMDGRQATESFTVQVKPAPPSILFIAVSDKEIRRGEPVTMCYGVAHANSVRLEPLRLSLPPSPKNCSRFYPPATLKYTLIASGVEGQTDRETFTVKVR